jgi:hypothetical protein
MRDGELAALLITGSGVTLAALAAALGAAPPVAGMGGVVLHGANNRAIRASRGSNLMLQFVGYILHSSLWIPKHQQPVEKPFRGYIMLNCGPIADTFSPHGR